MSAHLDCLDKTTQYLAHPNDVVGYWEGVSGMQWDEETRTLRSLAVTQRNARNDLFAAAALCGLLAKGVARDLAVEWAWKTADDMVRERP